MSAQPRQRSPLPGRPRPGAAWRRAFLLLAPLAALCFAVRACADSEKRAVAVARRTTEGLDAAVLDPSAGTAARRPGGGSVLTEEDESVALRRTLATLPLDDEARLLLVLEQRRGSPGRRDGASAMRLAGLLRAFLQDDSVAVRAAAVALLGRMSPSDAFDVDLVPSLSDRDARVRAETVKSLAIRGPSERAEHLLRVVDDPDPRVRRAVAEVLGRVQTHAARAALLRMLRDPDGDVVRAAGTSLARTLQELPPELVAVADSPRPIERIAAAHAVAALGAGESLAVLRKLSGDEIWEVRCEALRGLGGLAEPHAAVAKQVLEDVARATERPRTDRLEALQALAQTPVTPDAAALFEVASADADPVIRMTAARTLLARGDLRGLGVLADILAPDGLASAGDGDREFVSKHAAETLAAVAGAVAGDGSSADWKSALPGIRARLVSAGFEYVPRRLPERW